MSDSSSGAVQVGGAGWGWPLAVGGLHCPLRGGHSAGGKKKNPAHPHCWQPTCMSSSCIATSLRRSLMPASSDRLRPSRLLTSPDLLQQAQGRQQDQHCPALSGFQW